MPLSFRCPQCGTPLTVPEELAGQNVQCGSCQTVMQLPATGLSSAPASGGGPKPLTLVLIGCGCLFLLLIFVGLGGVAFYYSTREKSASDTPSKKTDDPPPDDDGRSKDKPKIKDGVVEIVPPRTRTEDPLSDAPKTSSVLANIPSPQEGLGDIVRVLEEESANNPELKREWEQFREQSKALVGIDIAALGEYGTIGIDATKPITLAVLEIKDAREPGGAVLSLGVSNAETALGAFRKIAEKSNIEVREDKTKAPVVYAAKDAAAAIVKDRIYICAGSSKGDTPATLREFLAQKDSASIRGDEAFESALDGLGGSGQINAYWNLPQLFKTLPSPERPPVLNDLSALAMSVNARAREASIYLSFVKQAGILPHMQPGSTSRPFLATLEKPLGVMTISLADPMALVKHLIVTSAGDEGLAKMNGNLKQGTGLDVDGLGAYFKDGAGGALLYDGGMFLAYLKLKDKTLATELFKTVMGNMKQQPVAGTEMLYVMNGQPPIGIAIVGDYLVIGSAVKQIVEVAQGGGRSRWEPKFGGSDLIAVEFFAGDFFQRMAQQGMKLDVATLVRPGTVITLVFKRRNNGLFVTGKRLE